MTASSKPRLKSDMAEQPNLSSTVYCGKTRLDIPKTPVREPSLCHGSSRERGATSGEQRLAQIL